MSSCVLRSFRVVALSVRQRPQPRLTPAFGALELVEGEEVEAPKPVGGVVEGRRQPANQSVGLYPPGRKNLQSRPLCFCRKRADCPNPMLPEIRISFWRLTDPGTPTRTGRSTPPALSERAHPSVVFALKQSWVMTWVACGDFSIIACERRVGGMRAWPSG
jgi:hypothetical protein